jgi:hypothetical protein
VHASMTFGFMLVTLFVILQAGDESCNLVKIRQDSTLRRRTARRSQGKTSGF